jgi:anti-sigma factor RsiW
VICRVYEEQLSAYLDGELPAARAARLEAHLRVCPHCRGELNALIGIAEHIRAASRQLEVSQEFDQRVLRAVGYLRVTGCQQVRRRSLVRPVVGLIAAMLALLGMAWHLLTRPPAPRPAPEPALVAPAAVPSAPPIAPPERRDR